LFPYSTLFRSDRGALSNDLWEVLLLTSFYGALTRVYFIISCVFRQHHMFRRNPSTKLLTYASCLGSLAIASPAMRPNSCTDGRGRGIGRSSNASGGSLKRHARSRKGFAWPAQPVPRFWR